MKWKTIFIALFLFLVSSPIAFSQSNTNALYKRAQKFIQSGDYSNAIIVLKRSLALQPESALYRQKLAYAYSLNRAYKKAEDLIKTVLKSNAADVQTYQIAGNIYQAEHRLGAAERNFKRGLEKFPESGVLYSELGQVYYSRKKYTKALQSWIAGIKVEPDYAENYYYAARTYYYSDDKFWTLIYGEIFIDLERFTNRTSEMKKKLLSTYKEIIGKSISLKSLSSDNPSNAKGFSTLEETPFKKAVLETLAKSAETSIKQGVSPETLMMTRTHFLLNWGQFYKMVYPYYLFDYYRQLLANGLFEAYNQWLFGPAADPVKYKAWVKEHLDKMHQLIAFLNNHSLVPRKEQFYQKGEIKFNFALK